MSDDVIIKVSADAKAAEQSLDRMEDKIEATAQTAGAAGQKISDAGRAGGGNLDEIGQKSERAAGQLLQLSHAVAAVGRGETDLQSLAILSKELTGTLGDLGETLTKMGGSRAALGGVLANLSGMLGPIGLLVAGATTLYTLWKSFNSEAEKSVERIQAAHEAQKKYLDTLKESVAAIQEQFTPKANATETAPFREFASSVAQSKAFPGTGNMLTGLVDVMLAEGRRRRIIPAGLSDDEARTDLLKQAESLIRGAASGNRLDMDELTGWVEFLERERGQLRAYGSELNASLASFVDSFRGAEEKAREDADRAATTKLAEEHRKQKEEAEAQQQREQEQAEAEAVAERRKHFDEQVARGVELLAQSIHAGRPIGELLEQIAKALEEEGVHDVPAALDAIQKELDKQRTGFADLNRRLAEEQRIRADAVNREKELDAERRKLEEAELASLKQREQQILQNEQNMQLLTVLLDKLGGNFDRLHEQLTRSFRATGASPRDAARQADAAVQALRQRHQQQIAQRAIERGLSDAAFGPASARDAMRRAVEEARRQAAAEGRGATRDDLRRAAIQARDDFARRVDAEQQGLAGRQQQREREFAEQNGRVPNARERRRIAEAAFAEQQAARNRQQQPPQGPMPDFAQFDQNARQMLENHARTMNEFAGFALQLGQFVASMNHVNAGARQVVQQARQRLPGPGARR